MKTLAPALIVLLLAAAGCSGGPSDELVGILDRVAALDIGRGGYTLGKTLSRDQRETARLNPVAIETPGTYKFRDGDLFVVAEQTTDRVIVLYEQHDPATRQQVEQVVGALFLAFGEPTVFAHDKIIYWAFDANGRMSEADYNAAKAQNKKPEILATVKLSSAGAIVENQADPDPESVYYIIASDPVLQWITGQ